MTTIKTLAVLILSTAIATPAFAQDVSAVGPHHARTHDRNYRRTYNQLNGPSYATPASRDGVENFGFGARDGERDGLRDPSRVGGQDPSFNPPS